ncbi:MAG: GerMN domain-containing protein [Lachnospiraceae bacterium]
MLKKLKIMGTILLLSLLFVQGCSKYNSDSDENSHYDIYYLDKDETTIVSQEYQATHTTNQKELLVEELLIAMEEGAHRVDVKPIISEFSIVDFELKENHLTLNMDTKYKELPPTTEILVRAALVRSLTEIEGIEYVSFLVRGEVLLDNLGNAVGSLNRGMFLDNEGDEINAFERVNLLLYFTNKEGDALVSTLRTLEYSTNLSVERLVVEQLIAGPVYTGIHEEERTIYPTISPDTKVISVTTKDGICYVNLDESFLVTPNNISPEIAVYSIVNSLVELSNINKVQILIRGESSYSIGENLNFSTLFERNLELR